jgi:hypothetical protein
MEQFERKLNFLKSRWKKTVHQRMGRTQMIRKDHLTDSKVAAPIATSGSTKRGTN